jgi:HK97 family phage portal protein
LGIFQRINKLFKGSSTPVTMEILRGIVTWSGQNADSFITDGLAGNDIVYSVINLITNKAKVAEWGVFKVKDEKKYIKLKSILSQPHLITNWKEVNELKNQAVEPYNGDDKLNELLKYPNDTDTWSDLIESWGGFKLSTGNAYIYAPLIGAGFNNGKPLSLTSMPSQYMSIIANINVMPRTIEGYRLYIGQYWEFEKPEILHDKYFNPRWNASGMELYGMSPLQAAAKNITRSNESKTASVANLQNGGPAGVLFTDDLRMEGDTAVAQANALKGKLAEFSGSKNKNKIATSGYKVGWQQIGLSNVDLDIIKQELWDMRSLCNIYGVPSQLLNDPENKIMANATSAEKALTVRAAIPLLTAMRDNLNRKLGTDWGYKGKNIVVDFDLSCYPELQEDKQTQVNWLKDSMLPLRRRYEIMGESIPEYLSEDILNTIYVNGQAIGEPDANVDPIIDPYKKPNE